MIGAGSWAGSSLWTRREARLLDGQVLAAADLAKRVLEGVAATQPPPDYAMIAGSQQQFDTAEVTRQNGRRELDAGRYDDAAIYLRLALQGFETTCERLAREQLEPQLVAIRDDLDARGKELEALGAESLTPVRWSEFQAKRGALVTAIESASACERGDRSEFAQPTRARCSRWRRRSSRSSAPCCRTSRAWRGRKPRRRAAKRSGTRANPSSIAPCSNAASARSRKVGTAADSGRHVEARDTLRASAADFEEAAKLGDAIVKRKRVGEAEDRAVARRVRDFGVASLVLSRGEERFAARDWTAAGASYERAVGEIDALVAPPEPVAVAPRTPAASSAAREPATRDFDRRRIFGPAARGPDPEVRRLADGSGRRAVDVGFSVDANPATAGPEYSFAPAKPGRNRIAALATDAQGATASDAIEVEVAANRAPNLEVEIEPAKDWTLGDEARSWPAPGIPRAIPSPSRIRSTAAKWLAATRSASNQNTPGTIA